jgi:hypothetical protein
LVGMGSWIVPSERDGSQRLPIVASGARRAPSSWDDAAVEGALTHW